MAKKSKKPNPFLGRWRIISMELWDEDFIDEEEEGYFEFDENGWGTFYFGCVYGQMDCQLTTRDGEPAVEWSWDGNDEMEAAQGRGWAILKGGELHGMIFYHAADASEFVAKKKPLRPARKKRKR